MSQPKSSEILMEAWYLVRDRRTGFICNAITRASEEFSCPGSSKAHWLRARVMTEIGGASTLAAFVVRDGLRDLLPMPEHELCATPQGDDYMRELRLEWLSSLINDYRAKGD